MHPYPILLANSSDCATQLNKYQAVGQDNKG